MSNPSDCKPSNYKLCFTLKQHTPMIHFQSDQQGATLRASELKPKLDRFLLEQEPSLKKLATEQNSLNYKVKIAIESNQIENIEKPNPKGKRPIQNPLFFGNMGEGEKKRFVTSKKITVEFFSFQSQIVNAIQKHFEAFIASTNFGTRQSKGFGSFYIESKQFNPSLIQEKVYHFESKADRYEEDIKLFYSLLRSGINMVNFQTKQSRFYAKALSFLYAKSQGMSWDKRAIKQAYFNNDLKQQQRRHPQKDNCINYTSEQSYIIRDLFGLSTEQSWMSYRATISKESKNVDRLKSPITFKPIAEGENISVYFWANHSIEKILDTLFVIKNNKHGNLQLKTPKVFSFDDFFSFAFKVDLSSHIEHLYQNTHEYKTLNRIFTQLRRQV